MKEAVSVREVLYEFRVNGGYVKVTAVDPESGTEVSIVGAASAGERLLKATARRKLDYVLEKNRVRAGNRQV